MNAKSVRGASSRKYSIAITIFIVYVVACLAFFFVGLFSNVDKLIERRVLESVDDQTYHLNSVINIRFQYLEAIAEFFSSQEDITAETAEQFLSSLSKKSGLDRTALIDLDGTAFFENGETYNFGDRDYFIETLKGERVMTVPLESRADGDARFVLSVPIMRGDKITGVVASSVVVDRIASLMFTEHYDGHSLLFVSDGEGNVFFDNSATSESELLTTDNLFTQIREATFPKGENGEDLIAKIQNREKGFATYTPKGGRLRLLAYAPVEHSEWMFYFTISRDDAFSQYGFVQLGVVLLSVSLLLGVGLLVLFLITSNSNSQRDLIQYARTDLLTDLLNKLHTEEAIEQWLSSEECTGIQAMLFLDIDHFKQINDQYGHSVGDEALRVVGKALRQEFRSSDIIGRVGGDEFIVFMRNVPVKHAVRWHAASLCSRLKSSDVPGLEKGILHCSIGISYAPEHGNNYRELYLCADKALYQTKSKGRDGFTEYAAPLRDGEVHPLTPENDERDPSNPFV